MCSGPRTDAGCLTVREDGSDGDESDDETGRRAVTPGGSQHGGGVVRRATLERGVNPSQLARWRGSESAFEDLLASVGVDEDTQTTELLLRQVPIASDQEFAANLAAQTAASGEHWLYFTLTDGASRAGLALPVAKAIGPRSAPLGLYVEIHSRMAAWWLTYAWRSTQLVRAASTLASAEHIIPAACCARALFETAAAFWIDARKVAEIWQDAKAAGVPSLEKETVAIRQRFIGYLNEVQFGAKFTDKAPAAAEVFGRQPRGNVLTAIDKLARNHPADVHNDYQWLCNTVHPSIGTALVFSAPPLMHDMGTHVQRWFAGVPLMIDMSTGQDAFDQSKFIERSIPRRRHERASSRSMY